MLSSRNSGKYLSKEWAKERERCAHDRDNFTPAEQEYLEVTGQAHGMGDRDRIDENLTIDTTPVASDSPSRTYDVRKEPWRA